MREYTRITVDRGVYLGLSKNSLAGSINQFTNHSCDPSCWLVDAITLVEGNPFKKI